MQKSNVVYTVTCSSGHMLYIGQTCQILTERIYQHKHAINTNDIDHSALAKHAIDFKHVNFDKIVVRKGA